MSDENTIRISVADEVTSKDNVGDKTKEDEVNLVSMYVAPHNMPSRRVEKEDLPRVLEEGKRMLDLCAVPVGLFRDVPFVAHTQIDNKDPLRFFVFKSGSLLVNPEVVKPVTDEMIEVEEASASFPGEMKKTIQRYKKVLAKTQVVTRGMDGELTISGEVEKEVDGNLSVLMQMACEMLNGVHIYDIDYAPGKAVGVIAREDVDKDEK
jgi:peptide deformylase